jgi:hypothetical protein
MTSPAATVSADHTHPSGFGNITFTARDRTRAGPQAEERRSRVHLRTPEVEELVLTGSDLRHAQPRRTRRPHRTSRSRDTAPDPGRSAACPPATRVSRAHSPARIGTAVTEALAPACPVVGLRRVRHSRPRPSSNVRTSRLVVIILPVFRTRRGVVMSGRGVLPRGARDLPVWVAPGIGDNGGASLRAVDVMVHRQEER